MKTTDLSMRILTKMYRSIFVLSAVVLFGVITFSASDSLAQTGEALPTADASGEVPPPVLQVGIKAAVPFAMKNDDGSWTGISV